MRASSPDHTRSFVKKSALATLLKFMLTISQLNVNVITKNIDMESLKREWKAFTGSILEYCKRKETNDIRDIYQHLLKIMHQLLRYW